MNASRNNFFFQWLFFRKMLIRDLTNYNQLQAPGIDVVTIEGDQKSGKGVLVGGYYDTKVSYSSNYTKA